jgi:SAM-dependent methyltransferase
MGLGGFIKYILRTLMIQIKNYPKKIIARKNLIKRKQEYYNNSKEIKIVFGGHWSDNPGWLLCNELEQDITKPLNFEDDSVDVIFIEHVLEHVKFLESIHFFREAKRILKIGGTLRVVGPIIEKILSTDFSQEGKANEYLTNFILPHYFSENENLEGMGIKGIFENPKAFFFNSNFNLHGHKFIWSAELMKLVLEKIGFSSASIFELGEGNSLENCIERRRRGIYLGNDWKEEIETKDNFNVDSLAIEAIK